MYDEFDIQKPFQVFLLTKGYNERHFARRILDEFQSFTQKNRLTRFLFLVLNHYTLYEQGQ